MKILVLNCGSSSIKYALYNMDDKSVMTSGGAERVGLEGSFVKVKLADGSKKQIMHDIPVLKTDDIHPPKTVISVHFSCSLS